MVRSLGDCEKVLSQEPDNRVEIKWLTIDDANV